MAKIRRGLFWFSNDLRLHDNPALTKANSLCDELICIYIFDKSWFTPSHFSQARLGQHRRLFLFESLCDLDLGLEKLNQKLFIFEDYPVLKISQVIEKAGITDVFKSSHAGWDERQQWQQLQTQLPDCQYHAIDTHTLFKKRDLPFSLRDLPTTFTKFRKAVIDIAISEPLESQQQLPSKIDFEFSELAFLPSNTDKFKGGETAGIMHLEEYFAGSLPAHYKKVRNALDGWENSTKFSPWLACGALSPRTIMAYLREYEDTKVKNESTYWIYFELLWREYFQWYAHKFGSKLFQLTGIKDTQPLNSFYPERYQKWVNGNTPYPIVNACMRELATTGYLSNRGRQIVASCFVNELAMDWRYGAAYFETMLIDYDVASNWGNWQYLAGVGADAQPKRHFNLTKQASQYDPQQHYIKKWNCEYSESSLDSVDAADWPIA